MSKWGFLTKHALVISIIDREKRITTRELGTIVGIHERAVQRIVAELCADGYIMKTRQGKNNLYSINAELPLRTSVCSEIPIGNLLRALNRKRRKRKLSSPEI